MSSIEQREAICWNDSDGGQLDQEVFVAEAGHHDGCADWWCVASQKLCSNALNDRQMGSVHEIGGDRYDVVGITADRTKHGEYVVEALPGLQLDVSFADNPLMLIPGNLAGQVDNLACGLNDAHAEAASFGPPNTIWIDSNQYENSKRMLSLQKPPLTAVAA